MKALKKKGLEEFGIKDDIGKDIKIRGVKVVRGEMRKIRIVNIINVKDQEVKKKIEVVDIMMIIGAQKIIKVKRVETATVMVIIIKVKKK